MGKPLAMATPLAVTFVPMYAITDGDHHAAVQADTLKQLLSEAAGRCA